MNFQDYRHNTPIQIRFSDIDRLNHVNNACYLTYLETARLSYFHQVFHVHADWSKAGFFIARCEINYMKPLHLEDEVVCFTRMIGLGSKSMTLKSALAKRDAQEWTLCAEAIVTLVAMDYTTRISMPVPELWRRLIGEFEGTAF